MFIKRVCVEEGFLHGLDLALAPGLTVLIGARGSGKTSVIELIRFCLASSELSDPRELATHQQVQAVLGSGKVTVTLDVDGEDVFVSRSLADEAPRFSSPMKAPSLLALSQNEIERVGRNAASRLRLVDGFAPSLDTNTRSEDAKRAMISSLTVELRGVLGKLQEINDELAKLAQIPQQLEEARRAADAATSTAEKAEPERVRLEALQPLTAAASVRVQEYRRIAEDISSALARVRALTPVVMDPWPAAAESSDPLAEVRSSVAAASSSIAQAAAAYESAANRLVAMQQAEQQQLMTLEDEARTLRTHLDSLSDGAGVLMKRVSDLVALEQRGRALGEQAATLKDKAADLHARREQELDALDGLRETRVNAREHAAAFLNDRLGPRIRVTVNRFGSVEAYSQAIAESLRGSGLQYNVLAPELARTLSPRELALAAERGDAGEVARLANLSADRAQRLVAHLRDVGTESILTAPLEDTVQLALLDGGSYKPADELSLGQRCTVVLPIVLSHSERVLLVDQPEDNLDNSFIADTLVKALRGRPSTAQLIFATHNPNVPVLGEADCVVLLASDGKRGEVTHCGDLDDAESVRAITEIMEGGREAFERRAAFYARG